MPVRRAAAPPPRALRLERSSFDMAYGSSWERSQRPIYHTAGRAGVTLSFTSAAPRGMMGAMMRRTPLRYVAVLPSMLLACLLASISACGDDTPASTPGFNGCGDADFVDRTAAGADRTVAFGSGANPFAYAPKCITVAAGQAVTFMGDLAVHPLSPGTSPAATTAGTAGNPIARTGTGNMVRVTFASAGTYPYFCELHYAGGMVGVVRVR